MLVRAEILDQRDGPFRGSALGLLAAALFVFSLLHFHVDGFERPSEYEPIPQVGSDYWVIHAPRLERAWAKPTIEWSPNVYFHSLIVSTVHRNPITVYLSGFRFIRGPPV
jgi:hypothetical protein